MTSAPTIKKNSAKKPSSKNPPGVIAFQGIAGAYSDLACRDVFPAHPTQPCRSFEETLEAVQSAKADMAVIPIENAIAGRVAEIHQILPHTELSIIAEHYQPVSHCLLGLPGARIENIRTIRSHIHALSQCRDIIRALDCAVVVSADTAGAALEVAQAGDPSQAAIASFLAAETYGLDILKTAVEDVAGNVTRFLVLARQPLPSLPLSEPVITSFIFFVRNVPAAIYKALGGFATNAVNMTRLESFMIGGSFSQAQFFADIEGQPGQASVDLAFEELRFFSRKVRILGTYPAHPFRRRDPNSPSDAD